MSGDGQGGQDLSGRGSGADDLTCASCGRALDGDRDEDPVGNAGEPICGECVREANFFDLDIADGELDDQIDA